MAAPNVQSRWRNRYCRSFCRFGNDPFGRHDLQLLRANHNPRTGETHRRRIRRGSGNGCDNRQHRWSRCGGALIGGPVGLIAGALIGDQLMGQEQRQKQQSAQTEKNQREIERLRQENARLRSGRGHNDRPVGEWPQARWNHLQSLQFCRNLPSSVCVTFAKFPVKLAKISKYSRFLNMA